MVNLKQKVVNHAWDDVWLNLRLYLKARTYRQTERKLRGKICDRILVLLL